MEQKKHTVGDFLTTFNGIESALIALISSFFIEYYNDEVKFRSTIFNRILFDEHIIVGFEQKLSFLNKINKFINQESNKVGYKYDNNKWKDLSRRIKKIQEVRNIIAHKIVVVANETSDVQIIKENKENFWLPDYSYINIDEYCIEAKLLLSEIYDQLGYFRNASANLYKFIQTQSKN